MQDGFAVTGFGFPLLFFFYNLLADFPVGLDHDAVDAGVGFAAGIGEDGLDGFEEGFVWGCR